MSRKHDSQPDPQEQQGAQAAQRPEHGKRANDHNKVGDAAPTQKNEGRRTPESRGDVEAHIGADNQSRSRRQTGTGGGKGPAGR